MMSLEVIGIWIGVFLTLSIFSYLYDDNPFYKAAEHLFIGVSAGYVAVLSFWQQIQPNLFGRLWPKVTEGETLSFFNKIWYWVYEALNTITTGFGILERSIFPEGGIKGFEADFTYLIPLILGLLRLMRLVPKFGWMARWSIAYIVGVTAGLKIYAFLSSDVLSQISASSIDFTAGWGTIINSIIVLVGTLTGLIYFFFSKEHTGTIGKLSRIGIYFLMIKFGASFGFAVMGRISLLIGRFNSLIKSNSPDNFYATYCILVFMIICLIAWTFFGKNNSEDLA